MYPGVLQRANLGHACNNLHSQLQCILLLSPLLVVGLRSSLQHINSCLVTTGCDSMSNAAIKAWVNIRQAKASSQLPTCVVTPAVVQQSLTGTLRTALHLAPPPS